VLVLRLVELRLLENMIFLDYKSTYRCASYDRNSHINLKVVS
jgi:hypothetical protein